VLVDLGAGYCELVNAARCRRRIAVDLNPETRALAEPGVEVQSVPAGRLAFLKDGEVNMVFSSNFLEHLPDKAAVTRVLEEARRVLRPGGTLVLIGPNARVIPGAYWDYFDHQVALTEKSQAEALTPSSPASPGRPGWSLSGSSSVPSWDRCWGPSSTWSPGGADLCYVPRRTGVCSSAG
jgi:SAM-dependent methyltransferase